MGVLFDGAAGIGVKGQLQSSEKRPHETDQCTCLTASLYEFYINDSDIFLFICIIIITLDIIVFALQSLWLVFYL